MALDSMTESTNMVGPRSASYTRTDVSMSDEHKSWESEDVGSDEHCGQSLAAEQYVLFTDLEAETFRRARATREPSTGSTSPSSLPQPLSEVQQLDGKTAGQGVASGMETGIASPAILAKGSSSTTADNGSGVETGNSNPGTHANGLWSSNPESISNVEGAIPNPVLRANEGSQSRMPILRRALLSIGSGAISKLSEQHVRNLLEAARTGTVKVIQRSLEKGGWACTEVRDQDGNSLLHVAAANGHKDIIDSLLSMPGRVLDIGAAMVLLQVKNSRGQTALHLAARAGHMGAVEALLCPNNGQEETGVTKHNEQIDIPDHDHRTPIHLAARNGHSEVLEMLIHTSRENYKAAVKMTRRPSSSGDSDQVKIAFQSSRWAGLGSQDKHGWTAYHHAAANGHVAVLESLIAAEGLQLGTEGRRTGLSDVNVEDWKSWTALHVAASHGHLGAVEILLRHPESWPNRPDRQGWTALHVAAIHGKHEVAAAILRWGLRQGVDLDVLDHNGASAMTLASTNGRVNVVREILKAEKMLSLSVPPLS